MTTDKLQVSIKSLISLGFNGVNVTIPHKTNVLAFADSVTDRAALIGGDVVSDSNGKYYEHYIFADYLSKELFVYDFKNDELFQFPLPLEFDSYITALIVHPEDPNKTLVTTGQGDLIEITIL